MKYVLMFTSQPELDRTVSPERNEELLTEIYRWFETNAAVIADGGAALQDPPTAKTVRAGDPSPVVVDGPFSEAKEVIGGFSIIDVPDMDAAVALARTWPELTLPGKAVEIRPMFEDEELFADVAGEQPAP
ncbi:YciI family protein [Microbacterium sp. CIAB417]|uniref:YciI family protein n=1 Tax=Microbacterium sp. CIAB417 TaxID=2860287 RepID=UPI001FAD9E36|nr:YciI family protein [Microbacterium sp. CIAB417]